MITKNTYDELGQLISKNVGGQDITGTTGLQTVDYSYNIRGWLKNINDIEHIGTDLFSFKISYNNPEDATALYNGNISETFWKTSSDNVKRKYKYSYDNLNRLLEANYNKPDNASYTLGLDNYLEKLAYDKNGNILSLQRNGDRDTDGAQMVNLIDNLEYTYDTNNKNLLIKVDDASNSPQGFKNGSNTGNDYEYDANGNMTLDNNKGITKITYNHLNLPTEITFGTSAKILYLYNATGQKISKTIVDFVGGNNTTTHYMSGGFQYKDNYLQFFPHAEGYVNVVDSHGVNNYNYVFNYTDHLGNIRLSYGVDPSTQTIKIMEENHYYAFGLKHTNYNSDQLLYQKGSNETITLKGGTPTIQSTYKYRYNGKELQTELGLNMYDYGARNYDPALGRWMNIDPLAEQGRRWSPYNYAMDNPVFFIDPDGMLSQSFIDRIANSESGTTWVNTGNGTFTDGESEIDENGDPKKTNITNSPTLKAVINFAIDGAISTNPILGIIEQGGKLFDSDFELMPRQEISDDQMVEYYSAMIILAIIEPGPGGEANLARQLSKGIQKHHVIPKAVYKSVAEKLEKYMKLNGGFNLKNLPKPFHGNHPQYNTYVTNRINKMIRDGDINATSIKSLQKELSTMINSAYEGYKKNGQNLNDYFKIINGAK